MIPIPPGLCCKKCGSVNIRAERGNWGPHTERINCLDCRAVTWGFGSGWKTRARAALKAALDHRLPGALAAEIEDLLYESR